MYRVIETSRKVPGWCPGKKMKKDLTVDTSDIQTPSEICLLSSSNKCDLQDENALYRECV